MAKKAKPKRKKSDDKQTKAIDDTVELYIPQAVWDRFVEGIGDLEHNDDVRSLFSIANGEFAKKGMRHCNIYIKENVRVKSADADDDDDCVKEPKLCDEGGEGP